MDKFDCKEVRDYKLAQAKELVEGMETKPSLIIIQVGSRADSTRYVRNKINRCLDVGIEANAIVLPESSTTEEVIETIKQHHKVSAIIVQCPLPKHIDEFEVINAVPYYQDCDGLTVRNVGLLHSQKPVIVPATAQGIIDLFDYYNIDLASKNVLLVGRSNLVNRPLYELMLQRNATPTIAHTKTKCLDKHLIDATYDIIVGAIGKPLELKYVNAMFIIDVGINVMHDGTMVGDFDIDTCYCGMYTTVPSGVGLLTQQAIVHNVIKCHNMRNNI